MSSTPCPHISGLCDFLSPGINLPRPLTAFEQHHLKNYNATTFGPVSVIGNKRAIFEGMFKTSSFGSKDLRKSFSSSHRVKAPSALPSSIADGSDPLAHLMRLEHQIKVREHKRLKRHNFDDREAARYCARTHVKSVLHEEHLDNYKRSLTCKKVEQELCEACEKVRVLILRNAASISPQLTPKVASFAAFGSRDHPGLPLPAVPFLFLQVLPEVARLRGWGRGGG